LNFGPAIRAIGGLPTTTPAAAPTNPGAVVPASATSDQPDYQQQHDGADGGIMIGDLELDFAMALYNKLFIQKVIGAWA
jgi:hypothetical protein